VLTLTGAQDASVRTAVVVFAASAGVDDGDTAAEAVTVALGNQAAFSAQSGTTAAGGAAPHPTASAAALRILDKDQALTIALGRTDSGVLTEGASAAADREAVLTVTLSRDLFAGESYTVPLAVSGAGVTADDFALAAATGQNVNTGVTLDTSSPLAPAVTFANAGARTATLVLTVADDADDEPRETLAVALGTLTAPLIDAGDTNRDGDIDTDETATSASAVLVDNDATEVTLSQKNAITRLLEDPSRDRSGVADRAVQLEVKLNRALGGSEMLEVPIAFAGASPGAGIAVECRGLPCAGFDPMNPTVGVFFADAAAAKVTFTPTSGQAATLYVRGSADSDTADDAVTVSIPASSLTGTPRMTGTGLGGGATGTGTASFTVIDTASIETITAKMLGGGSIGGAVSSGAGSAVDAVIELSRPLAAGESVTLAVLLTTSTGTVAFTASQNTVYELASAKAKKFEITATATSTPTRPPRRPRRCWSTTTPPR